MRARAQNREFVDQISTEWVAAHDRDDVVRRLQAAGGSVGPALDHTEIAQSEQFLEHESVIDMQHPRHGTLRPYGVVPKFSHTPARVRGPVPDMGQHNDSAYGDQLGLGAERLAALRNAGII